MRIVQAVFGVFHHFELAHQLHRRHHLQRIYSTWPWRRLKREGLPHELVRTFAALHTAHYLLGRTGYAPPRFQSALASWTALAFDHYTSYQLERDPRGYPDALIAISGAGLLTGRKLQQLGGKYICDRGSTHQRYQDRIVSEEYKRWNIPPPLAQPHITRREEAIYAQADAITVPSTVAKSSFIEMGVAPDKVHVIPYGVRLDKFSPSSEPSAETFDLLFAGGVSLRKGVPYLLEAFAQLRHPHKQLTIVGSISQEIRPLLARLPTDNVTFAGSLPQPELARIMANSHALVLPSVEEGLALVMAQAMACGCPVIATAATGAEDLFTDGVEGIILADCNIHSLTAAMQRFADEPTLQQTLRGSAQTRVKTLGGWNTYGDRWETLLKALTRR